MQDLSELLLAASREVRDVSGCAFTGADCPELQAGPIDVKDSTFERCGFIDCRFSGTGFQTVLFRDCDLSGCMFFDGGLKSVRFENCRMMGVSFQSCTLNAVKFSGCLMRYATFTGSVLKAGQLTDCNVSGGSFARTKCPKSAFSRCDFTGCDFTGAFLGGLDLRDSIIDGATWSLSGLKDITITPAQAVGFSKLLGLNIP